MSDLLGETVRGLYRVAGYAAVPAVPLLLAWRAWRGKEERARRGERYGRPSVDRPQGPMVWVHAASVGETNAVLPLIARITGDGLPVLLTTVTVTSARVAARRLPPGALHQYAPLDVEPFVDRFLDAWRPGLALFMESELWPTTMTRLAARGIPEIRINARMSQRSFRRWRRFGGAMRPLFAGVAMTLAQSEGDAERLGALGLGRVRAVGNLKFDVPAPGAEPAALDGFRAAAGGRKVFVAASTHEGEEAIAADAHAIAGRRHPGLLTVVVPRHPARGPAIRDTLAAGGFAVALRSLGALPDAATDIYVADTLGELGLFYRLADAALVGGTLVPVGGHNPIEAALLGVAILHGPHVQNAAEIYAALDRGTGTGPVVDAAGLAAALDTLLADPGGARAHAEQAQAALAPFAGALDATLAALRPYLAPMLAAASPDRREAVRSHPARSRP